MSNGLRLRLNIENLKPGDLVNLRAGYAALMNISDNRGYNHLAGLHGLPGQYCWHGPLLYQGDWVNLFLPWHRAYLLYFENALLDQKDGVTIPWWDWTSATSHAAGLPAVFSSRTLADGSANVLFKATIDIVFAGHQEKRDTTRSPGPPADLPSPTDIQGLLALNDFKDFSDQLQGPSSPGPHNQVHGWVGGDMGVVPYAAFDPIFWSHHAMIDRVWYLWQLQHGINNIPQNYLDKILQPFGLTVRQVLDITALGYMYASAGT